MTTAPFAAPCYAVLKHEDWTDALIFAAPTYEEAEEAAWAYARVIWEESAELDEGDETTDEAWENEKDDNLEWSVITATTPK